MSRSVHLFRGVKLLGKLLGKDRLAVVSILPSSATGHLVQVARGTSKLALTNVKVFGPLSSEDSELVFSREVAALKTEGFTRSGIGELLIALDGKSRRRRALAARRLGWMREPGAVEPLLQLASRSGDEQAVALDALAAIGDPRAVPAAVALASKKLLSKRRSGFEALRKLAVVDSTAKVALAEATALAMARLADPVRAALGTIKVVASTSVVAKKERGLVLDTLYELDQQAALSTLLVAENVSEPHLWRYAKSIWKRSMLRHDVEMFGLLAHRAERLGRTSNGTVATVKSGYDGEPREMRVFGKKTQRWFARASWRYMRRLAVYRPGAYVEAACAVLARYELADEAAPHGLHGAYADAHLLARILWGESPHLTLRGTALRFRTVPKALVADRPESYPALWDAHPMAYLRLLGRARLPVVVDFALRGLVDRHPKLVELATAVELAALLGSDRAEAIQLATTELARRFDPASPDPDFTLVEALLSSRHTAAVDLGVAWLARTATTWTRSVDRVLAFLAMTNPRVRSDVWAMLEPTLPALDERPRLAAAVFALLEVGEKEEGEHDVYAQLGAALAPELAASLTVPELVSRLSSPHAAVQAVAASALAVHPDVFSSVTTDHLTLWGQHEHALVRAAAQSLVWRMRSDLSARAAGDSSLGPLLAWVDSQWDDARAFAVTELGRLPAERVSEELMLGFCDSNHPLVQDLGKRLLSLRIDALDAMKVLRRLAEHPHANMRRYALDLATKHLQPGFVSLAGLESFFRTLLLDTMPERAVKAKAIDYLGVRGLTDINQAEVAARLLGEMVASRTQLDREPALLALTRIQVRFPGLESAVKVRGA